MADVDVTNACEKLCELNGDCFNQAATNTTRPPSTTEGMVIAYGSLLIMALLPVFFGSFRSVKSLKEQKLSGEKPEHMTRRDAAMFPFVASATLFGLYIFFMVFGTDYINLLLTIYFFGLGVLALCHLSSSLISSLVPAAIKKVPFKLVFTQGSGETTKKLIHYEFSSHDVVCLLCCSVVGAWYLFQKHWILNNLFGIAFAINGVELLHLNNVVTGFILLGGLFIYDIFWVFGTNVMVTVAKSFEAPIKLIFPQDILEHGLLANNFAMLGLGDIVVPGIFIALLLRFDESLKRNTNTYFYCTFIAYFVGLVSTIAVMHVFNAAQPALLYLVPLCIGTPCVLALIKGDIGALFQYEDHPNPKEETPSRPAKALKSKKEK